VLKIAALIVTYNPDINLLNNLIEYLKSTDIYIEIFLVDNASNNSKILKDKYNNESHFLFLAENVGLAEAQNLGLEGILKSDCEAVLFFDQDSVPNEKFIKNLIQGMDNLTCQGQRIGAVGPVFYDPRTGSKYPFIKINGVRIKKIYPSDLSPLKVSILINSGMLVPLSTLRDVGVMRSELFIDYVDIEWCFRAIDKKYSLYAIPSANMSHSIGDDRKLVMGREISIHSPIRRYYLARNSIYMLRLPYVPVGYKVREFIFSILRNLLFIKTVDNKLVYIRYILKGWKDGMLKKYGKFVE